MSNQKTRPNAHKGPSPREHSQSATRETGGGGGGRSHGAELCAKADGFSKPDARGRFRPRHSSGKAARRSGVESPTIPLHPMKLLNETGGFFFGLGQFLGGHLAQLHQGPVA